MRARSTSILASEAAPAAPASGPSAGLEICGARSLVAGARLEIDLVALAEIVELDVLADARAVEEDVVSAVVRGDESEALVLHDLLDLTSHAAPDPARISSGEAA